MPLDLATRKALNVPRLYEFYMVFSGDVARCSIATNVPEQTIRDLALEEKWDDRLHLWNELKLDQTELQNYLNRSVNYIQAHRLRAIIDDYITELTQKTGKELVDLSTETTKEGQKISTRFLTDLVKATEACQNMTYRALGDNLREGTVNPSSGGRGDSAAILVMKAMEAAEKDCRLSSAEVVKKQLNPPHD